MPSCRNSPVHGALDRRNGSFLSAAVATALLLIASLNSTTAAPTTVSPWHSAGNGNPTGGFYGTVPNMYLEFFGKDSFGSSPNTAQMRVWALWGTLFQVSYSPVAWADVTLAPNIGWLGGVSLFDFELGSYFGDPQTSQVRIYNGDYSSLLYQDVLNLGASAVTITPNLFSPNGMHVQFSGTPGYVAIDNIRVEAGNTVPAPEPSSVVLFGAGVAGIAAFRRRRREMKA
jgi:hypothetical protein